MAIHQQILFALPLPPPSFLTTWDPATLTNATLSGGNLTVTGTVSNSAGGARVADVSAKAIGKYYIETLLGQNFGTAIGVAVLGSAYLTLANNVYTGGAVISSWDGTMLVNGSNVGSITGAANGARFGHAIDLDNRRIWFRVAPSGNWNNNASYNPATNTGGWTLPSGSMLPYLFPHSSGDVVTANFGASAFTGAVPSGFIAGWPI